jgi:anaerobic magnesium-protoporphyrin IX monomethyl ester cyclase
MTNRMLIIVPPTLGMGEIAKKMRAQTNTIPYGVLSLVTYVKSRIDADLRIFDLNIEPYSGYSLDELLQCVKDEALRFKPEIVGLSVMYNHMYNYVGLLSAAVKVTLPDALVVAGGSCIMAYYEKMLEEFPSLDAICYSEGELPLTELLASDNRPALLERHPAWLTLKGLRNEKRPQFVFVDNLDDIPPVDFDLVDITLYGAHRSSFRPVKKEKERCLPIVTTRGCPYNCVFCIGGALHGKKVRKMSAGRVIADVKSMVAKYGMNVLSIEDDQFLADRARSKAMLEGLAELDIGIIADSGFTVMLLDEEIARLLYKAGLQTAILAIESGSDYVLHDIIDKPIKLDRVPGVVKNIRDAGLYCHCFLILGLPGEKREHRRETVEYVKKIGIDWCNITCATPIRGSRLYDLCVEKGYIKEIDFTENAFYVSCITTPDFTAEEITREAYLMNLELNFVHNYRMRIKDYRAVSLYMDHILTKYPDHAFAHYYLARALEGMGDASAKVKEHDDTFHKIVASSAEWKDYADHFGLT